MDTLASVEKVSKRYRSGVEAVMAVDEADFGVGPGEFACVYGTSGSGKTTLLNILAGIEVADSGSVVVAGESLVGQSETARADIRLHRIGVVFQSNNLLPEFTARENVALPLRVRGMARTEAEAAAETALGSVGLAGLGDRLPGRMSGGQRQRVGIARALAGGQPLLLADEPTGALDSENSRLLFGLMRALCDDRGTAVVLATHDPLAREFADSVYGMVDGVVAVR